uniref:Uncharacterized protein n=1 Tax=uncultured delta proteobacterium HF0010_01J10 TaxID=710820 RepID=E0XQB9_9DELT|nr:hypothetical protein [uncultured delta proteobacterium HF0010_01J10]
MDVVVPATSRVVSQRVVRSTDHVPRGPSCGTATSARSMYSPGGRTPASTPRNSSHARPVPRHTPTEDSDQGRTPARRSSKMSFSKTASRPERASPIEVGAPWLSTSTSSGSVATGATSACAGGGASRASHPHMRTRTAQPVDARMIPPIAAVYHSLRVRREWGRPGTVKTSPPDPRPHRYEDLPARPAPTRRASPASLPPHTRAARWRGACGDHRRCARPARPHLPKPAPKTRDPWGPPTPRVASSLRGHQDRRSPALLAGISLGTNGPCPEPDRYEMGSIPRRVRETPPDFQGPQQVHREPC